MRLQEVDSSTTSYSVSGLRWALSFVAHHGNIEPFRMSGGGPFRLASGRPLVHFPLQLIPVTGLGPNAVSPIVRHSRASLLRSKDCPRPLLAGA